MDYVKNETYNGVIGKMSARQIMNRIRRERGVLQHTKLKGSVCRIKPPECP